MQPFSQIWDVFFFLNPLEVFKLYGGFTVKPKGTREAPSVLGRVHFQYLVLLSLSLSRSLFEGALGNQSQSTHDWCFEDSNPLFL